MVKPATGPHSLRENWVEPGAELVEPDAQQGEQMLSQARLKDFSRASQKPERVVENHGREKRSRYRNVEV
jgi:hypothetical protein